MLWLIHLAILALYLMVLYIKRPETESRFGWKVVGFYTLSIVTFNMGSITLPLGFLIGLWIVHYKSKTNKDLKYLLLFFGLLYFVFTLILPRFEIPDLAWERQKQEYLNQFNTVYAVTTYERYAPQQEELRNILKPTGDKNESYYMAEVMNMTRAWLMKANNIPIESPDQLFDKWPWHEVGDSYSTHGEKAHLVHVRHFHGKQYFMLFERDGENSPFYLRLVVEHSGLKSGDSPSYF